MTDKSDELRLEARAILWTAVAEGVFVDYHGQPVEDILPVITDAMNAVGCMFNHERMTVLAEMIHHGHHIDFTLK